MSDLLDLGPITQLRAGQLHRRLPQLFVGLWLFGMSIAFMLRGNLGASPWDVLHSGLTLHVPLTVGQAVIATGIAVLLLWIPLKEKPGLGTLANAVVIGLAADVTLGLFDTPGGLLSRIALMLGGILLCALGGAIYIGAQFGRGPRDGLMTGLHRVTGRSLRLMRTAIELSVVLIGVLLGGQLGIGTVLFAIAIGPLTQAFLPYFTVKLPQSRPVTTGQPR